MTQKRDQRIYAEMKVNEISVICADDISCKEEDVKDMKVNETGFSVMKICVELIIKTCGIIAVCTLFVVPWTSIHRVDSIIYKNSWMEPNLPVTINW